MSDPFLNARLFKACAYCGLTRLCNFYGRRWLCDDCAENELGPSEESQP